MDGVQILLAVSVNKKLIVASQTNINIQVIDSA